MRLGVRFGGSSTSDSPDQAAETETASNDVYPRPAGSDGEEVSVSEILECGGEGDVGRSVGLE